MKIYLFDWNGTILNDPDICRQATASVFKPFDIQPPSIKEFFSELEKFNGDYMEIYRSRGVPLSREEINQLYGNAYKSLTNKAELFPHTVETLRALEARGAILGLVTTQLEDLTAPLLTKFDLMRFFSHLHFHSTDKEASIKNIIQEEGVAPEDCYMIGDAPSDIRHANNAGVKSVAFLNGFVPMELVLAANPRFVIRSFQALPYII